MPLPPLLPPQQPGPAALASTTTAPVWNGAGAAGNGAGATGNGAGDIHSKTAASPSAAGAGAAMMAARGMLGVV